MKLSPISKKDAKAAGLKRYFTGKPCPRSHVSERYVSTGGCVDCCNERSASPEGRRRTRQSKRKNYPKYAEYNRKWAEENREKFREYTKRYNSKNRSEVLARYKKRHKENPEANREWVARYRARRGLATPSWADRDETLRVYKFASLATLVTGVPHEVDHVVPLHGEEVCGLHIPSNLEVVPWWENREKSNKIRISPLTPPKYHEHWGRGF